MSQKLYEENNIQDIANAIRTKNGTHDAYTVAQMGNAIRAIKAQPDLETLTATENRTYLPSVNKDGFSEVTVNVPSTVPDLETLTATENGNYVPSSGKDGFSEVTVNVPPTVPDLETLTATENRTYAPSANKDGFSEVTVNVPSSATLYPIVAGVQGYADAANDILAILNGSIYYKYNSAPAYAGYYYDGTYTNLILVSTTQEGCYYGNARTTTEIVSHNYHLYATIPNGSRLGNLISSNGLAYKLSDDILTLSEAQQLLADNATSGSWIADHNGAYEIPIGYDGFKSFSVQVPTIHWGDTEPSSALGNDGDIYLYNSDAFFYDPTSGELLFMADPDYVVSDTTQVLSTHSAVFKKTVAGPAIALEVKSNTYYGPILISPVADYVKYTSNTNIWGSVYVDGKWWYISTTMCWDNSTDSPTIPTYYELTQDLGAIPAFNVIYGKALVRKFLELAHVKSFSASYIKRANNWNELSQQYPNASGVRF